MKIVNLESWFDPRLEIRLSLVQGRGIFANEPIAIGEILMIWGGRLFTQEEIKKGKANPRSISGFSEGLYLGQFVDDPDVPDQFLNHSCDPNVWLTDEVTVVSRRSIASGEELTADYALWELDSDWRMEEPCNCHTTYCRGSITGKDWRIRDVQARYEGHFLPCINERITKLRNEITYYPVSNSVWPV